MYLCYYALWIKVPPHVSDPRNTAPVEAAHTPELDWSPACHNTGCSVSQCLSSSADKPHAPTGQSSLGNSGPSTVLKKFCSYKYIYFTCTGKRQDTLQNQYFYSLH